MSEGLPPDSPREQERGELAERLYEEAQALPYERRHAFIDEVCRGDPELRAELASLLEHAAGAESFFERLAQVMIPNAPDAPPGTGGRYQILGCIGMGGMGAVYRARDMRLQRDVALKFLPGYTSAALDVEQRLLNEARAAAAIEHRNVCTVHEIAEGADGRLYIAMTFYEGETLKERLRRGRLPLGEAIEIALQIASGLGAAHAQGIVHRDIKPANIMLTRDGTVKLLDLGLAKIADANLTRPGMLLGTVAYMSPEQIRGAEIGPRSDLWSLGVVLYELLTGEQPFRAGSDRALLQAIAHENVEPVRKRAPDTPRWLEQVIQRLLHKQPEARYDNAAQLVSDLRQESAASAGAAAFLGRSGPRRAALIVLAAALIIGLAGAALWWNGRSRVSAADGGATANATAASAAALDAATSIAVLPFANLSRDPEQDYFSDGLTEELIGTLSRVRTLRVAARTSAFAFKGQNRDIREIGAALDVGAILEGSVRQAGERVRVEARLISVKDGLHLWSDVYERELTDIFAIQYDLALRIAGALNAQLSAEERRRLGRPPTANPQAVAHYLKGRHFWNGRTPAGQARAIEYYQRAIAADSQYAAAYAGLAAVYLSQGLAGTMDPGQAGTLMKRAAQRALELDDELPEAHAALALHLHAFEWDTQAAEREFLRAIELDPSSALARHQYGNLLAALRRTDEALVQKRRAVVLDPLVPSMSETLAFTLLRVGRPVEALQHVNNALELDSTFWRARAVLGLYYEGRNRPDDAIREYERANQLAAARIHRTRADIARVLARSGRQHEARAMVAESQLEAAATGVSEPAVATALLALGEVDAAFSWLEQSYRQRHPHLPFIPGDVRFADFDRESRFLELMRRVGVLR